jgi:hypothetical protein
LQSLAVPDQSKFIFKKNLHSNLIKLFNKYCKLKNSKWSVLKLRQISTSSPSFNAQPASPPPQNQTQPQQQQQQQQQKSSGGGGGSTAFKLIGLTVTSFALAVGYAVQNPDTRRQFESVIPQSSHLFSIIDGFYKPTPAVSAPPVDFPSKLKTYTELELNQNGLFLLNIKMMQTKHSSIKDRPCCTQSK